MIGRAIFLFFLIFPGFFLPAKGQHTGFDRSVFYKVMEDSNMDAIDKQLKLIEADTELKKMNKDAYSGALQMKSAGLKKGASKKLGVFKEGHKKLEAVIKLDSANAEWRFLRLIIQEHAPGILKYRSEIKTDTQFIQLAFRNLSPVLQSAILDYRKQSKSLQSINL